MLSNKLQVDSKPFVLGGELSNWEELTMSCTLLATLLSRLFISITVEIVMVDMFRSIFTVSSVSNSIKATVRDIEPTCLRLVSQEDVGTIMPSEPVVYSL